jgi:hypothetical protein
VVSGNRAVKILVGKPPSLLESPALVVAVQSRVVGEQRGEFPSQAGLVALIRCGEQRGEGGEFALAGG